MEVHRLIKTLRRLLPGNVRAVTVWKSNTAPIGYSENAYKIIYFDFFCFFSIQIKAVEWRFYYTGRRSKLNKWYTNDQK